MTAPQHTFLEGRGLLKVSGDDAQDFLQGLISNDVTRVDEGHAIYAALLTAQGKFLFDFFITQAADGLVLETERERMGDLIKKLTMYKLRAQVSLQDISDDFAVAVIWGGGAHELAALPGEAGAAAPWNGGTAIVDPRLAGAGLRVVLAAESAAEVAGQWPSTPAQPADYDLHRLGLGLPDGSRDLVLEKSILLESGFDELHGVDWEKGCYMGQELTARTKYRGLVKKRLVPVSFDGEVPEPGTPVMIDGKEAGELRSGRGGKALALMRLEHLANADARFTVGGAALVAHKPDWADF